MTNHFVSAVAWSFIAVTCSFVLLICWFAYILHANRGQIYFKYRGVGLLSFQLFLATVWICLGIVSYLDRHFALFNNYSWFSSTILAVCGYVTFTGIINTITMRLFYFVVHIELMKDANSRLVIQQCNHVHSPPMDYSSIATTSPSAANDNAAHTGIDNHICIDTLSGTSLKLSEPTKCVTTVTGAAKTQTTTVATNGHPNANKGDTYRTSSKPGDANDVYHSNLSSFARKHRSIRSPAILTFYVIVAQLIIAFLIGYAESSITHPRLQRVVKLAVVVTVIIFDTMSIVYFAFKRMVFKFDDYWCIGKEFRLYGKCISRHIVVFLISAVCMVVTGDDSNIGLLFHAVTLLSLSSMVFSLIYIMIIWVNNHHKNKFTTMENKKTNTDPNSNRRYQLQMAAMELVDSRHVQFVKHLSKLRDHAIESGHKERQSEANEFATEIGVDINQIVNYLYDRQTNKIDYKLALLYSYHDRSEKDTNSGKCNLNPACAPGLEDRVVSGLFTTKLVSFFEPEFVNNIDKKQQKIYRKEFTMFCGHCVRSLCMENLLFWVNCVQLLEFLIQHKYIDVDMDDKSKLQSLVFPLKLNFKTGHLMQQTDLISTLETNYRMMIKNAKNINNDADANLRKYEIFKQYYSELFGMFLKMNHAPFELNISSFMKEKFQNHYNSINQLSQSDVMTKEMFFNGIWYDIKLAAITTFRLLDVTFVRFVKKYGVRTTGQNPIQILSVAAPEILQSA